jgi:cysteinyl-tRNA synthetase
MAEPRFYNSLTKTVEPLVPVEPGKVRLYNCGPTVYKRQHLGNMRRFLFADFLRRTLEWLGYEVREITNITDVGHLTDDDLDQGQDKIEKAAQEAKTTPEEIAKAQIKLFKQDIPALNIQPAHQYPRATQHIAEMQRLIQTLLDKGLAYITPTGVYFSVEAFPEYGKLSGNRLEQLSAGARVAVREEKKHPADFALWKLDASHLQKWDSPWGVGYPGWHIECSAMSLEYLGTEIDIHTGGEDNRFPHHENEIAQSEGATGQRFVRLWMHNAHLQMGGKKVAKREGEQVTLDSITEHHLSPLAFRLLVFGAHYRQKLEFSWEALAAAQTSLEHIRSLLRRLAAGDNTPLPPLSEPHQASLAAFTAALADDLNTPRALAVVMDYMRDLNTRLDQHGLTPELQAEGLRTLEQFDRVLGVIEPLRLQLSEQTIPAEVTRLLEQREAARDAKDFAQADTFRQQIEQAGFTIEDTPQGPRLVPK